MRAYRCFIEPSLNENTQDDAMECRAHDEAHAAEGAAERFWREDPSLEECDVEVAVEDVEAPGKPKVFVVEVRFSAHFKATEKEPHNG